MTTPPEPDGGTLDPNLRAVMGERRRLIDVAYRLLGSLSKAEDVVQETYVRWYARSGHRQDAVGPADRVTLDPTTMAVLVVLEAMTPAERVAFILHDAFGYPFAEVAGIVGRTPTACRRLASSARHRVRASEALGPRTSYEQ